MDMGKIYMYIYVYIYGNLLLFAQSSNCFLFGHYGRKQIGSTGLGSIEKHLNAPSGMERVQYHNFCELWSGFVRPLVAICRYPLFCVCEGVHLT